MTDNNKGEPIKLKMIRNYAAEDPKTTDINISQGFTNSDAVNCPVEYSIVKDDDESSPLDGGLEKIFTVSNDNVIVVNQETYDGKDVNLKIKARTGFDEPVYQKLAVTQKLCDF